MYSYKFRNPKNNREVIIYANNCEEAHFIRSSRESTYQYTELVSTSDPVYNDYIHMVSECRSRVDPMMQDYYGPL